MVLITLPILLIPHLVECFMLKDVLLNPYSRRKRDLGDDDDDIYMFRNPNITMPVNRTRVTIFPEWLYYTLGSTPRTTYYYGQKGLSKDWSTFAWFNDRATVYIDTYLKGLRNAPSFKYPRYRLPSTNATTTTLSSIERMTFYPPKKDMIFKLPWAYLPHKNFRKEMGFGPNDTIDMDKVNISVIEAFEKKYKVTVMYPWPNTHPDYLKHVNFEKWKHTVVFSGEMSTHTPLNLSLIDFEEWFHPQVPRMKIEKVENLEYQLRIILDDVFDLPYVDKHIFVNELPHSELEARYDRYRKLRKREYRTWFHRKIYLPWQYLVKDGIREWFFARGKCVPSPGKLYFDEINKQFEQLSEDMNETLFSYFMEFENHFMHWYSETYGPKWNLSIQEDEPAVFTNPTIFSPVTYSDEFFIGESPGILPYENK